MHCTKCNRELHEKAAFCPHCGARLMDEENLQLQEGLNMSENRYNQNESGNGYGQNMYGSAQIVSGRNPVPPRVNSTPYLIWAVIVTILLCWPLGIPAIIYAAKIDGLQRIGEYQEACEAARKSKYFSIAAGCVGVFFWILLIIAMYWIGSYGYYYTSW